MNEATEIVMRWVLSNTGLTESDVSALLDVLKEGVKAKEQDSIQMVADMLLKAAEFTKSPPYDQIIPEALRLHYEIEELNLAGAALQKVVEIEELMKKVPADAFSQRIVARKVAHIVRRQE